MYVNDLRGGGGATIYISLVFLLQIDNTIETYGCMEHRAWEARNRKREEPKIQLWDECRILKWEEQVCTFEQDGLER